MNNGLQILTDFITQCKNVCYISANSLEQSQISQELSDQFCVIDLKNDKSPLAPFLEILRFYNPPFKLLENSVYPVQLEAFSSYIHSGTASNREDVVLKSEISFERSKIKKSIVSLLEDLNENNNYIFLNSQFLSEEAFSIAQELENSSVNGKFVFIFNENSSTYVSRNNMIAINKISSQPNFITGIQMEKSYSVDLEDQYDTPTFEALINSFVNAKAFLDLETLKYLSVYCAKNQKTICKSIQQKNELSLQIALGFYTCDLLDDAIFFLNSLYESDISEDIRLTTTYYLAAAYSEKKMYSLSQKFIQLIQNNSYNKNSNFYCLSYMLDYFSNQKKEKQIIEQKYKNAIDALYKKQLYSNYLYTALSFPDFYYTNKDYKSIIENITEKCLRISTEWDNAPQKAKAFESRGLYFANNNNTEKAIEELEQSILINSQIKEGEQFLNLCNLYAFEKNKQCKFKDSYNFLKDKLQYLYSQTDNSILTQHFINMSVSAFLYHDYKMARELFKITIELFEKLSESNLQKYQNLGFNTILLMNACIDLYEQKSLHAQILYTVVDKSNRLKCQITKGLSCFIKAITLLQEGEIKKSVKSFESCKNELEKQFSFSFLCFLYYEFAIHLSKTGEEFLAKQYINEGFSLALKNNFVHFHKNKESITVEDYINGFDKLSTFDFNLKCLYEQIEKDITVQNLQTQLQSYQFINKLNTYSSKFKNVYDYITLVSELICEFTLVQSVSFAQYKDNKWKNIGSFAQNNSRELVLSDSIWTSLFNQYTKQTLFELIYDDDTELYYCDLSRLNFSGAVIIIPGTNGKLPVYTQNILNIALASIQTQIIMYIQNENLTQYIVKDSVTTLNNRKALLQHIELESERIERLYKRKIQLIQKSIAVIDLENFKYYNERFGYNTGDFILQCFANLLTKTLRRIDFIARYDSDKFVIVMSDTSNPEGERMCQRIFIELAKKDFFIPDLKKFTKQDISIPENKKIGFSMGLCCNTDIEDPANLTEVLRNADKALAHSKEKGKSGVSNWLKMSL